jgi:hypothetical protein
LGPELIALQVCNVMLRRSPGDEAKLAKRY